ncbi:MAG: DUF2384 domain-containing protein [Pyrinomonadaceae bacterium MAG19_C2-C3]|nr:DUF2384 domain-containing protein [Pyrinomonadaceae bacterium MAG19_C2-C3]
MPISTPTRQSVTTGDITAFYEKFRRGRGSNAHLHVVLLGMDVFDTRRLLKKIEEGLSFDVFNHLRQNLNLPMRDLAELLMISPRTLSRRKDEGCLQPDESDRLVRMSRVFGRALELFDGDAEGARQWLMSPQRALGGDVPLSVAKTEIGAREVENVIGRLEHGVFT